MALVARQPRLCQPGHFMDGALCETAPRDLFSELQPRLLTKTVGTISVSETAFSGWGRKRQRNHELLSSLDSAKVTFNGASSEGET